MQTKQREFIRQAWQATITLLVVVMGTAGLSQPTSFVYKGNVECEQGGLEPLHMPFVISIRDGRVIGGASMLDIDGRQVGQEMGFGTVNPEGVFRLRYIAYMSHYSIEGDYTGTLNGTAGTLMGTQVLTQKVSGDVVTHTCKGTFLQVELPKR